MNRVQLEGLLIERGALRFTPAGTPVLEVQLEHRSTLLEAGLERRVEFGFPAIALGDTARQLAEEPLGGYLRLTGFLAPRSRRSTRWMVHVLEFSRCAPATGAEGSDERQDETH